MKQFFIFMLFILPVLGLAALDAKIISVSGRVEVREPGAGWEMARAGQVLSSKSTISTGFGSGAKLTLGGMELILSSLTRVTIDRLSEKSGVPDTTVSLKSGQVRAAVIPVVRQTRRELKFRVSTPIATAAVRGTIFIISTNKLKTMEGLVEVDQGKSPILVPANSYTWYVEGIRPVDPIKQFEADQAAKSSDILTDSSSSPAVQLGQIQLNIE